MTPERIAQLEQMLERGTICKGHIAEMLDAIKQRKPLTEDKIEKAWQMVESSDFRDCVHPFARAIEAKLEEKNEQKGFRL